MSYTLKINGTSHKVTVNSDGTESYDPPIPEHYENEKRKRFEEMCETRETPGLRTETTFWSGRGSLADQWKHDPKYLDMICNNVKKRGGSVSASSVYFQSLARPQFRDGDPEAMVSPAEGVAKIKKIYEQRGIEHSDGVIKTRGRERDPDAAPKSLAPDIIKRLDSQYRKADPDKYGKMSAGEMKEMINAKHHRP